MGLVHAHLVLSGLYLSLFMKDNAHAPFCFFKGMMKSIMKSQRKLGSIAALTWAALAVYAVAVEPNIENPLSLAGFFALLWSAGGATLYLVLARMHRTSRAVTSCVGSAGICYLAALGSLNAMSVLNALGAVLVIGGIVFVVKRVE
jgi:hypothetical protein